MQRDLEDLRLSTRPDQGIDTVVTDPSPSDPDLRSGSPPVDRRREGSGTHLSLVKPVLS